MPGARGLCARDRLGQSAEGILLDPVYTGKAFAGLLDLVAKGQLGSDEPIIFLHTGGLPALFAFEGTEIARASPFGDNNKHHVLSAEARSARKILGRFTILSPRAR